MKINIKMHTILNGEKGCYTKDELSAIISKILDQYGVNEGYSIGKDTFNEILVNDIANEFANKIPRNYDYDFNRLVAGLMGATCYMPDSFEKLNKKKNESILNIASIVENSGHHSTFGHSFLTLEISGIPKALAMVINNEHDYNTSEKSARYTVMKDIEPRQNQLYNKWLEIFEKKIKDKYPDGSNSFFDENGKKAHKLAQENARYMISVFTPTNMVYTTNFRQLNYICHWMEKQIEKPTNNFYKVLKNDMQEFVDFCKDNNLYSEKLTDGKDRDFSLFGDPILKKDFSSNYQCAYKMSFACLAQEQRHRTIDFNINRLKFVDDFSKNKEFYIPPIIRDDKDLVDEYLKDISSVAEFLPQGTMIEVGERGTFENFIAKSKERICVQAQKEIRDLTVEQAKDYLSQLIEDKNNCDDEQLKEIYESYITDLSKRIKGSRCTAGYKCSSPCSFKQGINLESDV